LCPGNARAGGARNPDYGSTFIFTNDFAALKPDTPRNSLDVEGKHLLVAEAEPGICRVICFSPRHDLTLATMTPRDIAEMVQLWMAQTSELSGRSEISYVQIFENRGAMMGASNSHPHCQIWATASIPDAPAKEQTQQKSYFKQHVSCLLCDYIELEQRQTLRMVYENENFVAVVPFWAVWPFELLVCSRRHFGGLPDCNANEVVQLAQALNQITAMYDRVFDVPFPYSMGFHQAPCDGETHPEWHLHAHFYPPLLRSASVRKFMVGFEMLANPQRDITPENAAERLRGLFRLP
jgi:UDPglucose--hexose-1-phosphate uridylyltransferase